MPNSNGSGFQYDRERVVTHDLAVVLKAFIIEWQSERPLNEGYAGNPFVGALEYMSIQTGISARRLHGIMECETFTTSFWMTDLILTRLNLGHKMNSIREVTPEIIRQTKALGTKKNVKFRTQEEWLQYLDDIGCRR